MQSTAYSHSTTFVTAFVSIYDDNHVEKHPSKSLEKRMSYFEDMAKSGIPICLYTCDVMRPHVEPLANTYSNVKLMDYNYENSDIYKLSMNEGLKYPRQRDAAKDSRKYMAIMHTKVDFMYHASRVNPWNTDTFAWIDFSIGYIYKNPENSIQRLVEMSKKGCPRNMIAIPGCWGAIMDDSAVLENIHWRFCGGFFIGNREMIQFLYSLYRIYYPVFLKKHSRILWEVNFWAWLEFSASWKPKWYYSNHDDSIIHVPANAFSEE